MKPWLLNGKVFWSTSEVLLVITEVVVSCTADSVVLPISGITVVGAPQIWIAHPANKS